MPRFTILSILASAVLFLAVPSCGGSSSGGTDGAAGQSGGSGGKTGSGGNGGKAGSGGISGAGGQVMDAGVDNVLPANECTQGQTCDVSGATCQTACTAGAFTHRTCTCGAGMGPGADGGNLTWRNCQNTACPNDGGTGFDAAGFDASMLDASASCPSGSCTGNGTQLCTATGGGVSFCRCQQGTWTCN